MLKEKSEVNVFALLAKPVRKTLAELGFTEPTLPQTMAVPTVLSGKNVLLIAPTGSGKTEAVLLPVFSKLIQQPEVKGIAVIYITPLRALNRDMLKRLTFWSERLGITASRILGKMHPKEDEFYMDLLKAKIQYLRTREFWDDREKQR